MSDATCLKYLRLSLQVIGVLFTCAVYPLTRIWPSGWAWHTDQSNYLTMIIGIYATLGIFLLIASKDPYQRGGVTYRACLSQILVNCPIITLVDHERDFA